MAELLLGTATLAAATTAAVYATGAVVSAFDIEAAASQSNNLPRNVGHVICGNDIIQTLHFPLYASAEDYISNNNPVGTYRKNITVVNGTLNQPVYQTHGHHDLYFPGIGTLHSTISNNHTKTSNGVFVALDGTNIHRVYSGTDNYGSVIKAQHIVITNIKDNIEFHKVIANKSDLKL